MLHKFLLFGALIIGYTSVTSAFTLTQDSLRGFQAETLNLSLNPTNCPASIDSELDFAIELWNNVPGSRLKLKKAAQNSVAVSTWNSFGFSQTVMIGCSTNFAADSGGAGLTTIGVGSSTMQGTGSLQKGYLIMNEEGGAGQYSTQTAAVRKFTMSHELGHVFGLGHSSVYESLMYPSVSAKSEVTLHQDDMDGISYFYPIDELGDSMLYGCGSVAAFNGGSGPRSPMGRYWSLLLLLPLFIYVGFRRSPRFKLIRSL